MRSVCIASKKSDINDLYEEYLLRKNSGFEVFFLDKHELKKSFGLEGHAAIVSSEGGQLDVQKFTHDLIKWVHKRNDKIFDKTRASKISYLKSGVQVITDNGNKIQANHLIYANGYEAQEYLSETYGALHSTYVVASEPFEKKLFDYILWETARPYIYMRTTSDNRVIAGGKDEKFYSPAKRDALLGVKTKRIINSVRKNFPV